MPVAHVENFKVEHVGAGKGVGLFGWRGSRYCNCKVRYVVPLRDHQGWGQFTLPMGCVRVCVSVCD